MIRKFIKKLLAPVIREVLEEIKAKESKSFHDLSDSIIHRMNQALKETSLKTDNSRPKGFDLSKLEPGTEAYYQAVLKADV